MSRSRSRNREDESAPPKLVAVAIEAGKSSQLALKWAADHILSKGQMVLLIHVRRKLTTVPTPTGQHLPISEVGEEVASIFQEQMDFQTTELLLPFQYFCSRRGLNFKEIILDGTNVPTTIVAYIGHRSIDALVMGVTSRNVFTRVFKHEDVPTSVSKIAPDFCSIYVISRGKLSSARPATNPKINKLVREFEVAGNRFQSIKSETIARDHTELPRRSAVVHGPRTRFGSTVGSERINFSESTGGHLDYSYQSTTSCPSPGRTSIDNESSSIPLAFLGHGKPVSRLSRVSNEHTLEVQRKDFGDNSRSRDGTYGGSEHSFPIPEGHFLMAHYGEVEAKLVSEAALLTGERTPEIEEREDKNVGLQATQKQIAIEANKAIGRDYPFSEEAVGNFPPDIRYRKYTIEEIKKATNNFSDSLKIGEGGYGPVFKSILDDTVVAIKVLGSNTPEGMRQFQREVEVLSCIRHPNMVLLTGACPEYGCLVYEFMVNGSLEDRLFCLSGTPPLSWKHRFKIAAEVASGLLFLHQTKPEPVVHRDLKPANILLDNNYVSKIADVGLARLVPSSAANSNQYVMTAAAGTVFYMDPEYQKTGQLSTKSDIYALGVILLQLITAKPPMGLRGHVERAVEMGRIEEILDPEVSDWPMEDTVKLVNLALACAELRSRDRPDLASVVLPELNRLQELADARM